MALKLPIYVIDGEQPVSMVETEDGGADLMGWDFEKKAMTRAAGSWDSIIGFNSGADWRQVTRTEFEAQVRKLERGSRTNPMVSISGKSGAK